MSRERVEIVPAPPPGPAFWHRTRSLWQPEGYHGWGIARGWFEGWYFKMVSADRETILALIPGIFHASTPDESHAFVQVLDGVRGEATYNRYDLGAFSVTSGRPWAVQVGSSRFSLDRVELDLEGPSGSLQGSVMTGDRSPWPQTWLSPGVMGPYTFAPFMQCYHGVLSMDHTLFGSLDMGGSSRSFDGGRGYIERDWGRSFPRSWIWMQSNHFERPRTSLMLSLATVPWVGRAFTGLIAGLLVDGQLYRFTTYGGGRIRHVHIGEEEVRVEVANRRYVLEVTAERPRGATLLSPEVDAMQERVTESMTGEVQVRLLPRRRGASPIFTGRGGCAGTEAVGHFDM